MLESLEKGLGEHQLPVGSGYEEWKIRVGLQANLENTTIGKSQAHHNCKQHSTIEVNFILVVKITEKMYPYTFTCVTGAVVIQSKCPIFCDFGAPVRVTMRSSMVYNLVILSLKTVIEQSRN